MSEQNPNAYQNEAQDTLEQFERAMVDPFVERVLGLAREYSQLLSENINVSLEDKQAIISDLDHNWGSIMDTDLSLTGYALVASPDNDKGGMKVFMDGTEVTSNGFSILNEPIYVAEEEVGEASRVVHHMYANITDVWPMEAIEERGLSAETKVAIAVEIDGTFLDLPGISKERAAAWLELACPGLIEELDVRMLNAQESEAGAFLSLQGFDIDEYTRALDDEFTRDCIDIYLNAIINFDMELPYGMRINGYTLRADQEDSIMYKTETSQMLAFIPSVGIWPKFSDDPEDAGKWGIAARIIAMPGRKDDQAMHLIAPVDSISLLYSVRNSFYNT
ncbi:MAG: hypothetical protein ACREGE_02455 [Candidatus Microsaccharimonas sp.]